MLSSQQAVQKGKFCLAVKKQRDLLNYSLDYNSLGYYSIDISQEEPALTIHPIPWTIRTSSSAIVLTGQVSFFGLTQTCTYAIVTRLPLNFTGSSVFHGFWVYSRRFPAFLAAAS